MPRGRRCAGRPATDRSRANRPRPDGLVAGLAGAPALEVAELSALYPDGRIYSAAERERHLHADRLVLQFPLQWYSTPLIKAWQDCVLTPLIYRETDSAASTVGLPVLAATMTGGPLVSYDPQNPSVMSLNDLFAPLRGTAMKCRWEWQPPFRSMTCAISTRQRSPWPARTIGGSFLGCRSSGGGRMLSCTDRRDLRGQIVCPPDTSIRWPLTQRLSGPRRLATMGPMSSGRPTRPSAVIAAKALL